MYHYDEITPLRLGEAAVLIAVAGVGAQEALLLTRRAEHLHTHSGEVALPGGKWDQGDANLAVTALREAYEEVGLLPAKVSDLQAMASRYTRQGTRVTPFVGRIPVGEPLTPCAFELHSLFWLPVHALLRDERIRTDIFTLEGKEYWAPVYQHGGYTIWGFTAKLLADFANHFYGAGISRAHIAPEVHYTQVVTKKSSL